MYLHSRIKCNIANLDIWLRWFIHCCLWLLRYAIIGKVGLDLAINLTNANNLVIKGVRAYYLRRVRARQ